MSDKHIVPGIDNPDAVNPEILNITEVKKQEKLIASIIPKSGNLVYELNLGTGKIVVADLVEEAVIIPDGYTKGKGDVVIDPKTKKQIWPPRPSGSSKTVKKVVVNDDCIYVQAFRPASAPPQFKKMIRDILKENGWVPKDDEWKKLSLETVLEVLNHIRNSRR